MQSASLVPLPESELIRLQSERSCRLRSAVAREERTLAQSSRQLDKLVLRLMQAVEALGIGYICRNDTEMFLDRVRVSDCSDNTLLRLSRILAEDVRLFSHAAEMIESTIGDVIPGYESPMDLPRCLMDGLVLCRFINALHPGMIPHVCTDVAPALSHLPASTLTSNFKALKNVDAFIGACRQVGFRVTTMCTAMDILQQRETARLVMCLEELHNRMAYTVDV